MGRNNPHEQQPPCGQNRQGHELRHCAGPAAAAAAPARGGLDARVAPVHRDRSPRTGDADDADDATDAGDAGDGGGGAAAGSPSQNQRQRWRRCRRWRGRR
eukprot:2386733-Heterocapsa_arctica.AAC.1